MIPGHVVTAWDGMRGIDCNNTITPAAADRIIAKGYDFVIRYVRRVRQNSFDLTTQEATDIINSGLGLGVVQHVAPDGWMPTDVDGKLYGGTAALEAMRVGIPAGVNLWCDGEGVNPLASVQQVTDFYSYWFERVAMVGYVPGQYVGYRPGLNGQQLYNLPFAHYWRAYNGDVIPAVRGFQMKQSAAKPSELVSGFTNQDMDVNTIEVDNLGGHPTLLMTIT